MRYLATAVYLARDLGGDRLALFAGRGSGVIGGALCQIGREDFSVPAAAGPDFHHRHVGPDSEETQCFRRMAIAVARDIGGRPRRRLQRGFQRRVDPMRAVAGGRSEEHTSELPSLMRIPYAVLFLTNTNPEKE